MPGTTCSLPFLQGAGGTNRPELTATQVRSNGSQPEMGDRCDGVCSRRAETLPFAYYRPIQWGGGELRLGAASQIRDDNPDARKGVSKDRRQHRITAALRPGMAIPDGPLPKTLGKERDPTKHVTKGQLSGQCNGRKFLFNIKVRDVLHAEVCICRTTRSENTSIY